VSNEQQINLSFPSDAIRERLKEIGYHDPMESDKALRDMQTIIVNLRLGKLMFSRRVLGANGKPGLFTYFKK